MGLEYAIIKEGPFDQDDIRYKSRGDCYNIRLDSPKNARSDFKLTNHQTTA